MQEITRKQLETLGLIHHSQEIDKTTVTDYYDIWEHPKVRLEVEYQKEKTIGVLYSFGKVGIDILFEGRLESIEDVEFILNRCL